MNAKQLFAAVAILVASSAVLADSSQYARADEGFVSTKTRAQVTAELKQAQADGSYQAMHAEYQTPGVPFAYYADAPVKSFAAYAPQDARAIALQDGSTVYVFSDGKMGMEDQYGHTLPMNEGHAMETTAGQKIIMKGNESARTDALLHARYGYGG